MTDKKPDQKKVVQFPPQKPLDQAIEILKKYDKQGRVHNLALAYTIEPTTEERKQFPLRRNKLVYFWFGGHSAVFVRGMLKWLDDRIRDWMKENQ